MPDPTNIHEVLKGYMTIVAKANGAVLIDPVIITEINKLIANPDDDKARRQLLDLLTKLARGQKDIKSSAAAELAHLVDAAKLVAVGGEKMTAVLSKIKPEPVPGAGNPAKLHGTGNRIIQSAKSLPFKNEAEQGDLSLRSLLEKMAKNPDLVMKGADGDEKKQMPDDKALWGVARLSGKLVLPEENEKEFTEAAPSTIWIGYVRIGRRVGRTEDRIVLVQISPEEEPGRRYLSKPQALTVEKTWHTDWLNRQFAAKPDPAIKEWNGWSLQALKIDKHVDLSDTGCFFGFFLIKAKEGGTEHYWNFRCASMNRPANAQVASNVPDLPFGKMTADQRTMYQNLITAARGNHEVPIEDIKKHFFGIKLHRATLGLKEASKKMPRSWAKAVYEFIEKLPK